MKDWMFLGAQAGSGSSDGDVWTVERKWFKELKTGAVVVAVAGGGSRAKATKATWLWADRVR